MPTIEVNIPRPDPITDITRAALQALITASTVQPLMWYRITDATPAPIIVRGISASEISTEAHFEGTFDGTTTTYGGFGTYDIVSNAFVGTIIDSLKNVYTGTNPSDLTIGADSTENVFVNVAAITLGTSCRYNSFLSIASSNILGNNCTKNIFENAANGNVLGNNSNLNVFKQDSTLFEFGENFNLCTVSAGLLARKADNSAPIDFITNATLIYNRSSPWEIIDIDRSAELIYVRFTYGDGQDPEEGWYDPATDVFTPVVSGGGVQSVTGDGVDNTDPNNPVIALAAVATSGAYSDLSGTPTIPAAQIQSDWTQANNAALDFIKNKPTIPAAQVNSDWDAGSGIAQILNKPTLATVATSGAYNDLSGTPTIRTSVVVPDTFTRNGFAQTYGAGVTRYVAVVGNSLNTLTTTQQAAMKINRGGVIPSVGFTLGTTQPSTGSLVVTLMRGSTIAGLADTAAVITIPANSVAGEYTYTGNITVNDGDYLVWKVVNNASGASGQDNGSWFILNRTITLS